MRSSLSRQLRNWLANSESESLPVQKALKHVENNPEVAGSDPPNTQPNVRQTATAISHNWNQNTTAGEYNRIRPDPGSCYYQHICLSSKHLVPNEGIWFYGQVRQGRQFQRVDRLPRTVLQKKKNKNHRKELVSTWAPPFPFLQRDDSWSHVLSNSSAGIFWCPWRTAYLSSPRPASRASLIQCRSTFLDLAWLACRAFSVIFVRRHEEYRTSTSASFGTFAWLCALYKRKVDIDTCETKLVVGNNLCSFVAVFSRRFSIKGKMPDSSIHCFFLQTTLLTLIGPLFRNNPETT